MTDEELPTMAVDITKYHADFYPNLLASDTPCIWMFYIHSTGWWGRFIDYDSDLRRCVLRRCVMRIPINEAHRFKYDNDD